MEFLKVDLAYVVSGFVGLIVWFSRLESKTTRNEKDIANLIKKHDTLESELIKDLNEVKLSLARIEVKIAKGE